MPKIQVFKSHDNTVITAIKVFFIMLCLFFLGVVFATLIPNSWVSSNADKSIDILKEEGNTSFAYSSQKNDGFTDNIMISMSESNSKKVMNPIEAAMDSSYISNANPEKPEQRSYERFWHGYTVLLKPMLVFFDISMIRQLIILAFVVMVAVVAYQLTLVVSRYAGLAFVISIAIFNPPVIMTNMQYFSTFAVMLVGSMVLLYLLQREAKHKAIVSLFLIIGGSTIFFDFLTTPIITWGVPLLIYIAYNINHRKLKIDRLWVNSLVLSIFWLLGYTLIWVSKWLIASVILQRNIIQNALNTTNYYTSADGAREGAATLVYTIGDMYELNIEYAVLFIPVLVLSIIASITLLIGVVIKKRMNNYTKGVVLLLLLTVVAPFVWMFFARSHSFIHHWMTNRDFIIATLGMLILVGFLWDSFMNRRIRPDKK